jgi:hypothetical protein
MIACGLQTHVYHVGGVSSFYHSASCLFPSPNSGGGVYDGYAVEVQSDCHVVTDGGGTNFVQTVFGNLVGGSYAVLGSQGFSFASFNESSQIYAADTPTSGTGTMNVTAEYHTTTAGLCDVHFYGIHWFGYDFPGSLRARLTWNYLLSEKPAVNASGGTINTAGSFCSTFIFGGVSTLNSSSVGTPATISQFPGGLHNAFSNYYVGNGTHVIGGASWFATEYSISAPLVGTNVLWPNSVAQFQQSYFWGGLVNSQTNLPVTTCPTLSMSASNTHPFLTQTVTVFGNIIPGLEVNNLIGNSIELYNANNNTIIKTCLISSFFYTYPACPMNQTSNVPITIKYGMKVLDNNSFIQMNSTFNGDFVNVTWAGILPDLLSNIIHVIWIGGVFVTVNLQFQTLAGTPVNLSNSILISYTANSTAQVLQGVDGANIFAADGNTTVTVNGMSQLSNNNTRWCLSNCVPFSFSSDNGTTETVPYWQQVNASWRWVPPLICSTCSTERPIVTPQIFSASPAFSLSPSSGTTLPTSYRQSWADYGAAWSTSNPFFYNGKFWTPNSSGFALFAPQLITISYATISPPPANCNSTNPFIDLISGCWVGTFYYTYSGALGNFGFGIMFAAIDVAIYLKTENPLTALLLMVAEGAVLGVFLPTFFLPLAAIFMTIGLAGSIYQIIRTR